LLNVSSWKTKYPGHSGFGSGIFKTVPERPLNNPC
jgi:hypothetical protein